MRRIPPSPYVGLTRAADRLLVCGAKGINKAPQGCWHDLVLGALQPLSEEDSDADGKIWRFHKGTPTQTDDTSPSTKKQIALPPWLSAKAPAALPAPLIVRPSDIADHEPRSIGAGNTREVTLLRQTLAHRLLQSLPDIPAQDGKKWRVNSCREEARRYRPINVRWFGRYCFWSKTRTLPSCSSRAAEPKFDRRKAQRRGAGLRSGRPSFGDQDEVLIADFKTDRMPPRRSKRFRTLTSSSSRPIAPCCKSFTPTDPFAPPSSGPKLLILWSFQPAFSIELRPLTSPRERLDA